LTFQPHSIHWVNRTLCWNRTAFSRRQINSCRPTVKTLENLSASAVIRRQALHENGLRSSAAMTKTIEKSDCLVPVACGFNHKLSCALYLFSARNHEQSITTIFYCNCINPPLAVFYVIRLTILYFDTIARFLGNLRVIRLYKFHFIILEKIYAN